MQSRSDLTQYLAELTAAYPQIRRIWLLGSRANGAARPESDWDLLVFGESGLFEVLQRDARFHDPDIDLLVTTGTDGAFRKPWGDKKKTGNLKSWVWTELSDDKATYRSGKWIPDAVQKYPGSTTGDFEEQTFLAIRLWPA